MFEEAANFNQDISTKTVNEGTDDEYTAWDVSSVINMTGMFKEAADFNQNIGNWNLGNALFLSEMFYYATSFNQDISTKTINEGTANEYTAWDVSGVTNMYRMIGETTTFNQDISNWNVSSVTNMREMFYYATAFDQDLSTWQIGSVTNMQYMFDGATLSTANYDALLISWAGQTVQSGVTFDGGNSKYSAGDAATARQSLIDDDSWTITDGGMVTTYTWDGSEDEYWETAGNWNLSAVPTASDNVIIPGSGSYTNAPHISGTDDNGASCNNLTVSSGATLTINGSLITNGTITNNGTIEYNKDFNYSNVWVLLSMPFADLTANTFLDMYLQQWNEPAGNWTDVTNISTPLTPVKGFSFFDMDYEEGKGLGYTFTFSGTQLNTGNQSLAITASGTGGNTGANLVGNPYPSYLDWDEVTGYGAKYTWNGSGYDQYVYVGGSGYGEGDQIVAPMEGFFILTESSGTFSLDNSMRTHTAWAKSNNKGLQNGLVLEASGSAYKDELWLVFDEQATENFELQCDAWKLLSYNDSISQLWSVSPSGKLSIDTRPECESIQLGFANNVADIYSIGIKDIQGITEVTLEDTKTGTFFDLTKGDYQFAWQTTDSEERFIIHLKATGVEEMESTEAQVYAANGQVYIKLDQPEDYDQFQLFDLSGRLIAKYPIQQQSLQSFDFNELNGVFLVQLIGKKRTKTKKVILK